MIPDPSARNRRRLMWAMSGLVLGIAFLSINSEVALVLGMILCAASGWAFGGIFAESDKLP